MYEMNHAEVNAVRKVILSRKLFRYQAGGRGECDRFEREFVRKLRARNAILVSSGTNALVAGLVAAGVGPGDEVLVPAYTFVATAAAVLLAGARPVVVNVDEGLGLSVKDARSRITARTRAIIPVHMDGLAADLHGILQLARRHRLVVIEDCAQALGGSYRGRRLGTWGDVGGFSLNENKILSCGEGGIVATRRPELYEKLFCLQDLSARYNPVKAPLLGSARLLGMSMRVSEIQGAIMRVQLTRLDSLLSRLRARKRRMVAGLEDLPGISVIRGHCVPGDCGSSLHLRVEDPSRAALLSRRLLAAGIPATFPSLRPAHVAWKWLGEIEPKGRAAALAELVPSMEIMMTVLKLDLDPSRTLAETDRLARDMRRTILAG